jgi:hypothetical protein
VRRACECARATHRRTRGADGMPKEGSKGIARGKRRANESDPGGAHVGDLGGARSGMWGSGGAPLGRMLIEGLGGLSSAVGEPPPVVAGIYLIRF